MQTNLPPQNIEAEESLICDLLSSGNTDIIDLISADDFYKSSHKIIIKTCAELADKKEPIDLITVTNALKSTDELKIVGGAGKLAEILSAPLPVNAKHTIKLIKGKAIARETLLKAQEIIKNCYSFTDVTELVDSAQKAICDISPISSEKPYKKISELLTPAIQTYESLQASGDVSGIPSGYDDLDHITAGFQKSDLIILAARPSMGKTAFALNCCCRMADNGVPGAFFSLEMSKEQLIARAFAVDAGVYSTKFRTGNFNRDNWVQILDSAERMHEWPLYIDDTPGLTYQELRRKARRLKKEADIQYLFIDYLQLMTGDKKGSRENEISSLSRNCKLIAKELNIPVIALSQLNRGLEARTDKRPMLSDLRESGAIEQDADIVMFLYREHVYNDTADPAATELNIAKQRTGPCGTVNLIWHNTTTKFTPDSGVKPYNPNKNVQLYK